MRHVYSVLAVVMLTATTHAQTGTSPPQAGVHDFPSVGAWAVIESSLPNGDMFCSAITRRPPDGPGNVSMAFVFTSSTTHFYLWPEHRPGLPPLAIKRMQFAIDGQAIRPVQVVQETPGPGRRDQIVADLPGAMLTEEVLPLMIRGSLLTVTAGPYTYSVPIAGYRKITKELFDCGYEVQAILGRRR